MEQKFKIYIQFDGDIEYTNITPYIKDKSIKINKSLCSDKFKFKQDTIKLQTIYNPALNTKFFTFSKRIKAYVTEDINGVESRYFTGFVAPILKDKYDGSISNGVSFEIVDNNELLDVDCPPTILPKSIDDIIAIYNPSTPTKSLVHILLGYADYFNKGYNTFYPTIINNKIDLVAIEKSGTTIAKLLGEILYEFGYVYYFDNNGNLNLYNWAKSPKKDTISINENDIQYASGIQRTRKYIEEDGYSFEYDKIFRKDNTLVYRADVKTEDSEGKLTGKMIAPNAYFPADPIHEPTIDDLNVYVNEVYQSYSEEWLPKDSKIVASYNNELIAGIGYYLHPVDPTIITSDALTTRITNEECFEKYGKYNKARFVLRNFSNSDFQVINQFDIRANVLYSVGDNSYTIPQDASNPKTTKIKYLHNIDDIKAFAQAYYNYTIKNGQFKYSISSLNDYNIGEFYTLVNKDYNAKVLCYDKTYDINSELYSYEFIGVDDIKYIFSTVKENVPSDSLLDPPKPGYTYIYEYSVNQDPNSSGANPKWSKTPPANVPKGYYVWLRITNQDNTYSIVRLTGDEGVQGLPGFSTAQIRLMKRSKTIPTNYNGGSVTYTFSTGAINFENNNNDGWALTPLTKEGDVYVIYASANAQTLTDEIKASEFTPPVILSEEAVAGKDGANVQTVFIFNTSLTTPALPSLNATHNFKTGLISGLNNNWKNGVEIQDGDKIWVSTATAFSYSESDSILPIEWNTPTLWKVKGDKGEQGIQGPQGEDAYQIQIYSSGGNAFRVGKANTTLTAYVFQGADDITDTIDSSLFRWIRKSQGTALADDIWNTSSKAVGKKQVFITPEDTIGRTVFSCEVDI